MFLIVSFLFLFLVSALSQDLFTLAYIVHGAIIVGGVLSTYHIYKEGWLSPRLALPLWQGAVALYCLLLIYRTSFEIDGQRYFCLFDDAMISMRYAWNVVHGVGLNWAGFGPPVEGFTHPLWLGLMIVLHELPLTARFSSLAVQLLSLVLLLVNIGLMRRLVLRHFSCNSSAHILASWFPAVFLLGSYYSLNLWAIEGMESALQTSIILFGSLLVFDLDRNSAQASVALGILFGIGFLTRMDMGIWIVVTTLYGIFKLRRTPNEVFRFLLRSYSILILIAGTYLLFRAVYFQDLLPNTFYLKLTGVPLEVRLLRGRAVFLDYMVPLIPIWLGALFALSSHRRELEKGLYLVVVVSSYHFYSIYVGGDAWEWGNIGANRFINFSFPLLFPLLNLLISKIATNEKVESQDGATIVLLLALLFSINGLWFEKSSANKMDNFLLLSAPIYRDEARAMTELALRVNHIVTPKALVAVAWAGIPAYFGHYRVVDMHGYNERTIARSPSYVPFDRNNYLDFVPGHVKWNFTYILNEYKPDIILHGADPVLAESYGYAEVEGIWVRKNSSKVKFKRLPVILSE